MHLAVSGVAETWNWTAVAGGHRLSECHPKSVSTSKGPDTTTAVNGTVVTMAPEFTGIRIAGKIPPDPSTQRSSELWGRQ